MQRPPIVSEFKRARIKNTRLKWQVHMTPLHVCGVITQRAHPNPTRPRVCVCVQVLRLGTLALTAGAGIFFVFFEEYNTVDTNGEHCFTGVRALHWLHADQTPCVFADMLLAMAVVVAVASMMHSYDGTLVD